jgi:hypothetical protein
MKSIYFPLVFLILGLAAHAETEWRTFTCPAGKQTFNGKLIAFNKETNTVTVRKRDGQTLHFGQDLISKKDREYVQTTAERLPPSVNLDVRFEQSLERTEANSKANVRTKKYDAGYKIILNSYTPQDFGNVEVEYMLIYHKDKVNGSGEDVVLRGSSTTALEANRRQEVETQKVELVSFFEASKATTSGGGCGGGGCSRAQTNVTPSKRSRDFLVGCIARVKVNGHVVEVSATAPNILREYEDEFDSAGKDYNR